MNWWVINQVSDPGGARGPQQTNYVVVQASTRPTNAVAGPFKTKADATAWQTSANTAGNSPGSAAGGVVDAVTKLAGLEGISHILGDFFSGLTDGKMWRSLGWILLGAALVVGAVVIFFRKPIEQAVGTIGGAALKAP